MRNDIFGIVWNPSKTTREELDAALPDIDASRIHWFETSETDAGAQATERAIAAGANVVIAAGGDGTVRAVAEYLADASSKVALGILPLGTGNLLARNLGVPVNDLEAAFERIMMPEEGGNGNGDTARVIDIGWAEIDGERGIERHAFTVMAGFGIDAHMITETDDDLKERAGWLAYVESLGRAMAASTVVQLELSVEGATPQREDAHTVMIGNCGTLQGGVTLLPDADPSDGELDLLVLSADSIGGWMDTLRTMAWDNGLKRFFTRNDAAVSSESTEHRRLTHLKLVLSEPREFEVDGDTLGEVTHVRVSVQPAAIHVR